MENYKIFIDSSADIREELISKYDIGFVPMNYSIDDIEYLSDKYLTEKEMISFYEKMSEGKITKTSQITPYMYKDFLLDYAKKGENILYFSLSSGLSNTYNNALLVKEELEDECKDFKFMVVDSKGASAGIGLLAEIASINKANGMSLEDNYNYMLNMIKKSKYWLYVDDLKYLKRGGRISSSKAFIATTLNIKPILTINPEGKLDTIGKKIGKHAAAKVLIDKYFESRDESYDSIYIIHSNEFESAEYVKNLILERDKNVKIHTTQVCPVIGSHTGPGTVAICHIGK